jgi:hypothetical protein
MNTTKRQLQALIRKDERYAAIADHAAEITRELANGFRDRADWVSGWGHMFVCPDCAAHLKFDPSLDYRPGENVFECPSCGCKTAGEVLDRAWVYYYRITYAEKLEAAAVCALLGDHDALDFLTRYFDFYADTYEGFAPHMGGDFRPQHPSKLMPQLLDEAVWCTYVLRALYPCRELFPAETLTRWRDRLFRPLVDVITKPENNNFVHNHVLWHMAAAGMAALTFDDASLQFAVDGEMLSTQYVLTPDELTVPMPPEKSLFIASPLSRCGSSPTKQTISLSTIFRISCTDQKSRPVYLSPLRLGIS